MSEHRPDEFEAEVLEALDAHQPSKASAAVRAKAMKAFLDGDSVARPAPRRSWRPFAMAAAAVAAAAAVVFFGFVPEESWEIRGISGPVTAEGRTLRVGGELAGGRIETGAEAELELVLGDRLILRVRPDSDFDLPTPPGRWWGRERALTLRAGEVFGSSNGPLGFALHLNTPEAHAQVMGTTFAVFRVDDTTCYCLFEGELCIATNDGHAVDLPENRRVFIYSDGREPHYDELSPEETMKLQMIHDAAH